MRKSPRVVRWVRIDRGLSYLSAAKPATEHQLPHNGGLIAVPAPEMGPPH
ncbi:hypothetical protein [Comamonas avium]|nr:hypothetical protein [Comamonas avium]